MGCIIIIPFSSFSKPFLMLILIDFSGMWNWETVRCVLGPRLCTLTLSVLSLFLVLISSCIPLLQLFVPYFCWHQWYCPLESCFSSTLRNKVTAISDLTWAEFGRFWLIPSPAPSTCQTLRMLTETFVHTPNNMFTFSNLVSIFFQRPCF